LLSFLNHSWLYDPETSTYVHFFQRKVRFTRMNPILQVLSLTLFEKMPLYQAFAQRSYKTKITSPDHHLKLFDT